MIDPKNITNFNRTDAELEEFMLFAIVVAGKKSAQQVRKLSSFLALVRFNPKFMGMTPLDYVRYLDAGGVLESELELVKMGQYTRIGQAFRSLAASGLDLRACSVADLEALPGIGPKTARFFVLHTRENARVAALDTHVLKWLRSLGHSTPKQTPPKAKAYAKLESVFLDEADRRGIHPAHLDLSVWSASAA